jgi:hypothetical protein
MTLIEAAQKALEALENVTKDYVEGRQYKHNKAIDALRTAIEAAEKQDGWVLREVLFDDGEPIAHREPAQPALVPWSQALESVWAEDDTTPPAAPVPSSWVETVAVNLVREGINKHKARELAAHFHGLAHQPAAQRQPLTIAELRKCFLATNTTEPLAEGWPGLERFARAIEAAHGIKEKNT